MRRTASVLLLILALLVSCVFPSFCTAARGEPAMPTVVGPDGPIEGTAPPEPDPEEEEEEDAPRVGSVKAELLVDYTAGKPLYEFNADKLVYPASTTKIMTALLVCEAIERGEIALDDEVAMTDSAIDALPYDASTVYYQIQPGEYLTVEDYLYCAMLESDCPSCNLLAEYLYEETDTFVDRMNDRAAELGCSDTRFVNPSGYHDDDQYTTAWDMYLITAEALRHDEFRKIVSTPQYTVPETNYHSERHLFSTNRLYGAMDISNEGYYEGYGASYSFDYYYEGAGGVKTGTTSAAGSCLVAYAVRDGMELITVVMGGSPAVHEDGSVDLTQYVETVRLFDLGFKTIEETAGQQEQEPGDPNQGDPESPVEPEKQEPSDNEEQNGSNGGKGQGNAAGGMASLERALLIAAGVTAAALIIVIIIYCAVNRKSRGR